MGGLIGVGPAGGTSRNRRGIFAFLLGLPDREYVAGGTESEGGIGCDSELWPTVALIVVGVTDGGMGAWMVLLLLCKPDPVAFGGGSDCCNGSC